MAFDSLFVGVSGLNAYQNQIDVISNNIANVGTTGFKSQRITFQDLLYQTQAFSTAPSQTRGGINAIQAGLGVKTGTIDTVFQQGGLNTTGINTDLALNGDGFFVLGDANGGGTPVYTRDGAFSLNQNGLLYDPSSGKAVLGYLPNAAGVITQTGQPGIVQIPLGLKSQAVGTGFGVKSGPTNDKVYDVSFGGNIDQTKYISAATTNGTAALITMSTTIYDTLGTSHLVNITFQPVTSSVSPPTAAGQLPFNVNNTSGTPVAAATRWAFTVTPTDGSTFNANSGYVFFDQNGQFINTSSAAVPGTVHAAGQTTSTAAGDQLTVANWNSPPGANNAVTLTATPGPIGLDFSLMSSLAGASTATTISQNGYGQGTLSNISIGQDGTITGAFTNGQNSTLGQVAVATFQNEQGLIRQGSNQFVTSANSGLAQLGTAASGRFGSIVSGSLEQSNVSLADEFTKMIFAQRSFEANSKSITTADQDLQTVISIKR